MKKQLEKLPFYNTAVLPYHYLQSVLAGVKYKFPGKNLHIIGNLIVDYFYTQDSSGRGLDKAEP